MTEKISVKLDAHEAASIAELLLAPDSESREVKLRWAIKLIKAALPPPTAPPFQE